MQLKRLLDWTNGYTRLSDDYLGGIEMRTDGAIRVPFLLVLRWLESTWP